MMRFSISILAAAAISIAASTAGAVEFPVVGDNFATVTPGESVTIDKVMTNAATSTRFVWLPVSASAAGKFRS